MAAAWLASSPSEISSTGLSRRMSRPSATCRVTSPEIIRASGWGRRSQGTCKIRQNGFLATSILERSKFLPAQRSLYARGSVTSVRNRTATVRESVLFGFRLCRIRERLVVRILQVPRSLSPAHRQSLEANAPAQLDRSRSTLPQALTKPCSGLAESLRGGIGAVDRIGAIDEVGDVERVEHLSHHRELVSLLERELLGEAEILRENRSREGVAIRQRQFR